MNIYQWDQLDAAAKEKVLKRPYTADQQTINNRVKTILQRVSDSGDQALYEYAQQFDHVKLDSLKVSQAEIEKAERNITPKQYKLLQRTITRIEHFHKRITPQPVTVDTLDGVCCTKITRAIEHVGLYVPGGSAPLISTMMMLAIPAYIAGCKRRVVCTPPDAQGQIHPLMLMAAKLCHVTDIFKIGGAQAIGAMAYGTESVPGVNKIYGPGNAYVTEAKQIVSQQEGCVGIDMPAGPSEVLVIADSKANPAFVASDLLAQAEHGPDSQSILITNDDSLGRRVMLELERQKLKLSRQSILNSSLKHIRVIVTASLQQAVEVSNRYAPEHLIIQTHNAKALVDVVTAAGSVFVGPWAPEALGDYVTGSNHVLPTYGYASHVSGLTTNDYVNTISVQEVSSEGIRNIGQMAMDLADIEGLDAHKNAVKYRLETLGAANEF